MALYKLSRIDQVATGLSPYELVFTSKPKPSSLRVFGSSRGKSAIQSANSKQINLKKMDPRGEDVMFLSYDSKEARFVVGFQKTRKVGPVRTVYLD